MAGSVTRAFSDETRCGDAGDDSLGGTAVTEASGVTRPSLPIGTEARLMPLVDCPICDHAMPIDATTESLDCDACGVCYELAPDAAREDLALAA
jgi:hypothetical protein